MNYSGWYKVHRKMLISPMFRSLNSKQRDVMMILLMLANHQPGTFSFNGEVHEVKAGQLITSTKSLSQHCANDVSEQNVRTALKKLQDYKFITIESTQRYQIITIVNWNVYQGSREDADQEASKESADANKSEKTDKPPKNAEKQKAKKDEPYVDGFEAFWECYPRRVEKRNAYTMYIRAIKEVEPEILIRCAKNYALKCEAEGTVMKYIKHPKTFLNPKNRVWEEYTELDERSMAKTSVTPSNSMSALHAIQRLRQYGQEA